jgi:hypothetical protein
MAQLASKMHMIEDLAVATYLQKDGQMEASTGENLQLDHFKNGGSKHGEIGVKIVYRN